MIDWTYLFTTVANAFSVFATLAVGYASFKMYKLIRDKSLLWFIIASAMGFITRVGVFLSGGSFLWWDGFGSAQLAAIFWIFYGLGTFTLLHTAETIIRESKANIKEQNNIQTEHEDMIVERRDMVNQRRNIENEREDMKKQRFE